MHCEIALLCACALLVRTVPNGTLERLLIVDEYQVDFMEKAKKPTAGPGGRMRSG